MKSTQLSADELRLQIKKIVHGDNMPDHFMSDKLLAKPDQILRLITTQDAQLKAALLDVLPREIELSDNMTPTTHAYCRGQNKVITDMRAEIEKVFNKEVEDDKSS